MEVNEHAECDLEEEELEEQERQRDADDFYDQWRDDCSSQLDDALKQLIKDFVAKENHYYSNSKEKCLRHSISCLEFELKLLLESEKKCK